jgi:hypothetical protein
VIKYIVIGILLIVAFVCIVVCILRRKNLPTVLANFTFKFQNENEFVVLCCTDSAELLCYTNKRIYQKICIDKQGMVKISASHPLFNEKRMTYKIIDYSPVDNAN